MTLLRESAPAKVNLYLHVTGHRSDGYHELDSLVGFAGVCDRLEAAAAPDLTLKIEGPFAARLGATGDNLVWRAAQGLRDRFHVRQGAALTLHKNLPVAAGLGGGSADAAAALRLLTRLWRLEPAPSDLHALAVQLGADVPCCLLSHSVYLSGIGEELEEGPSLVGLWLVLAVPPIELPTAEVFAAYQGLFSAPMRRAHAFGSQTACTDFLAAARNDLEPPAMALRAQIAEVLNALSPLAGRKLARMSGSGPACFALFPERALAEDAAGVLKRLHPDWWVTAADLT